MDTRARIVERLGAPALRCLTGTWRFRRVAGSYAPAEPDGDLWPAIYAIWHRDLLALSMHHRGRGIAALISMHRDGEAIARVLSRMGYVPVRGSSTRGGAEGLDAMIESAVNGRSLAFTPDGPLGPPRQCKPGVVRAAAATGLPIIPVAAVARPERRLGSWDRFRVPVPGAKVYVSHGDPLEVPPEMDEEEVREWTERVAAAIDCHVQRCQRAAEAAVRSWRESGS